ncbi:MAG: PTS sugar transporter subunit IIC [Christensenellales bacterium]
MRRWWCFSAATGALGYSLGGPVGAFFGVAGRGGAGGPLAGKTKVDIVVLPFVAIVAGGLVATWIGPGINAMMTGIGSFINLATELQPIPMGILVSVVMGMALTAPISSAAIAISLDLSGLAAGAATVGCCVNMLGFAVASYRENGVGGLISQGLGTSMLQVPNIVRKPVIWLPEIIVMPFWGRCPPRCLP